VTSDPLAPIMHGAGPQSHPDSGHATERAAPVGGPGAASGPPRRRRQGGAGLPSSTPALAGRG